MSASDKTSRPALRMKGESMSGEGVVAAKKPPELRAKKIVLVSPATAEANNGNWHTAHRWSRFVSRHCDIDVATQWSTGSPFAPDMMIALHARRSAQSIAAWSQSCSPRPLAVVLTGTDLYRDIASDTQAQHSLDVATHLVVLQDAGLDTLPERWRSKAQVIYQSAPSLKPVAKSTGRFQAVMVGHLRDEKDPLTFMRTASLPLPAGVQLIQIGSALEPALGAAASTTASNFPVYRWLGGLPRAETRQRIKRAHVLVSCSRMEGGAHVILEAVLSGTPVLASRINGNVGMLGPDYAGYFEVGAADELATLIQRCATQPDFLALLQRQCRQRAPLFSPSEEKRRVLNLVMTALAADADARVR